MAVDPCCSEGQLREDVFVEVMRYFRTSLTRENASSACSTWPCRHECHLISNHPRGGVNTLQVPSAFMKVREVVLLLERDGWYQVAQRGSHRQFRHATKPGRVTVAGNPNKDVAPGTLGNILRQAGLTKEER
jgi:predicted RNA binding protein YcfA (HicA-like mRNA interferase family)